MAPIVSAPLDWSQCAAVESIPGKVGGAWVFKGTRTPVSIVFENLEDGMTVDEIIEQYADLQPVNQPRIAVAVANEYVCALRLYLIQI